MWKTSSSKSSMIACGMAVMGYSYSHACQYKPGCLETWITMHGLAPSAAREGGTDDRGANDSSFQCPIYHQLTE